MSGQSEGVVTARKAFASRLKCAYVSLKGWNAVGAEFGISGGMAYRIANQGYWPKDKAICKALSDKILPPEFSAAADWLAARMKH